jgi:hypothetical protein
VFWRRFGVEVVGELGAGANAELCVGLGERGLDCADGDDELGGDLLVRSAGGNELRDAALGRG